MIQSIMVCNSLLNIDDSGFMEDIFFLFLNISTYVFQNFYFHFLRHPDLSPIIIDINIYCGLIMFT